jgi:hypothetical protein
MDAFGRQRTAAVQNLLDIKHVYDKNPLQISEMIINDELLSLSWGLYVSDSELD